MKTIFTLILLLITFYGISQEFSISGTLLDEKKQPLESATVYAETQKDSTLLGYTITDRKGFFVLEGQSKTKTFNLYITYTGYSPLVKKINLDNPTVSLGTLAMVPQPQSLDEVVVVAQRAPITIKKDTLEFNVASFKTKQDATVEDLLKKLPGVEVDENGKITVNGKEVNQILVNGKPFFGNDPTIATKNLPKDIVDKIQVVDTKTKTEEFTGQSGNKQSKTINITIDEDKNKGVFGRVTAGIGTDSRYKASGIANYFNNDLRISVLGGSNNVNTPGFSFNEIRDMIGGGRSTTWNSNGSFSIDGRSFGGQRGITTSSTAGASFTDDFAEKTSLSTDYFFSQFDSNDKTITRRENFIPDNSYVLNSIENYKSGGDNHAFTLNFETEIDSTFKIIIIPALGYTKGNTLSNNQSVSSSLQDEIINSSEASSMRSSTNKNFKNRLEIVKKIGTKGAFIDFNLTNEFTDNTAEDFQQSTNEIFGDNPETINRNQRIDDANKLTSFFSEIGFRQPLIADTLFLNFGYSLRNDTRTFNTNTFDFNDSSQDFTDFNTQQSTDFIFKNIRHTPSLGMSYKGKKFSVNIDVGAVFRTLDNNDLLHSIKLKRKYTNLDLTSWGNYKLDDSRSIYFNYYINNSPPDARQLQPFTDTSNPLFITTGNPSLKPTQTHTVYAGYNAYDFKKRSGVFVYFNGSYNQNQIVSKTTIDENLIKNATYENVTGGYRFNGGFSINKNVKTDSTYTLKARVGIWSNASKSINFTNGLKYNNTVLGISPNVGFTLTINELVEIRPRYSISLTNSKFSIASFETQNFVSHSLRLNTATFFPKNIEWRNDITYSYNPNVATGFDKNYMIWNMSIGFKMLKDNGLLKVQVYDLLKQNNNIRRIASQDYIQDVESTVLQQYFMFSFTYKLKKIGGKKTSNGGIIILD